MISLGEVSRSLSHRFPRQIASINRLQVVYMSSSSNVEVSYGLIGQCEWDDLSMDCQAGVNLGGAFHLKVRTPHPPNALPTGFPLSCRVCSIMRREDFDKISELENLVARAK